MNLLTGLKRYSSHITVVVSTADDGGSGGRLRGLYNMFAPGDAISCLAALMPQGQKFFKELLVHRFPGNRYGRKDAISGHKVGNLLFAAVFDVTKDVEKSIKILQKLFSAKGNILPATRQNISLSATTIDGIRVETEEKIDLGRYKGKRILQSISIDPKDPPVSDEVLSAIKSADVIVAGPGDLYTTILPVIMVPRIASALKSSSAKKCFVVNVANKPYETRGYRIDDFIKAVEKHLGFFPFDRIILNTNYGEKILMPYKYHYVRYNPKKDIPHVPVTIVARDLIDTAFPLYHNPSKLASVIVNNV